jgi:hypothetical protein
MGTTQRQQKLQLLSVVAAGFHVSGVLRVVQGFLQECALFIFWLL